jgi:hypothetical protein
MRLNLAALFGPKDAAAFVDRGDARRAKGEYDRAIRDFDEAIRLDLGARYRDSWVLSCSPSVPVPLSPGGVGAATP